MQSLYFPSTLPHRTYSQIFTYSQDRSCALRIFVSPSATPRRSFSPIISHGTRPGPSSNPLMTHQEALRLGANDYINKPFDAVQMREVIGRNVERTRVQRQSEVTGRELQELNERLRNELAQKERLASLGQASAEFVHDLSNP